MMDIKEALQSLPPPNPNGPERVWQRVRTESLQRWPFAWLVPTAAMAAVGVAALALWLRPPAPERTIELTSPTGSASAVAWSDNVRFTFDGTGTVQGAPDDLVIEWQDGTLHAEVEPGTGTGLQVTTSEASVTVVGTVFQVHRDALGTTTSVSRGKVEVACSDGWSDFVTAESPPHTCRPTRPAMLLGRASALREHGRSVDDVLTSLDRGLEVAPQGSPIRGELLALRMEVLSDAGRVAEAIRDADDYRALGGPRAVEVTRFAAWLALSEQGCDQGLPYLEDLDEDATFEDRVLLAECVVATDPDRAQRLMEQVDPAGLEPTWAGRARTVMGRLDGGSL